ncbi:UDP-glycosyltransferase 75C1-like [Typha latifolia]|uniref:UDP-glycosyltransferase 75C1-like n=1 Tax=Typha latifolia TaxID=4733 RepID=UPI003C2EF5BD
MGLHGQEQQHFLLVSYPAQGHINPVRHIAVRLASVTGACVTVSTAVSGHRILFPSAAGPDQEVNDGAVSYIPFSDGYDDGFKEGVDDSSRYASQIVINGSRTLSAILDRLEARGRRVTCVLYTLLLPWAVDVAHQHGIRSALYWIQPATVFACYYHYFHGYDKLITTHAEDRVPVVSLPDLPPLRIRDLPTFLTATSEDHYSKSILDNFRAVFDKLDQEDDGRRPMVLMNTFDSLEGDVLRPIKDKMEVFAIGPVVPKEIPTGSDLFKQDEKDYMKWLDTKPARSVVYVSFGSLSAVKRPQIEEIILGLKESGRPYLWVLRNDCREEGLELEEGDDGMVVSWCNQLQVLSHASVGCFVTHCGWNSTLETLTCGVPTVGVPQWSDQRTNAWLMDEILGMGVRAEVNEEGVLPAAELRRCLEVVMGEGEGGEGIRKKVEMWKEKAREAVGEGSSSERNLWAFLGEISARCN